MFPALFGSVRAEPMLADLLPIARAVEPDLVVRDAGEFAAPIVAAVLGVPCVTHAFGALPPRHRVEVASERVAPLWRRHGLEPRPFGGSYDHLYLDIYPPSLRAAEADHVGTVQSLRPGRVATGDERVLPGWVTDDGPPLLYVTFGTMSLFNSDVAVFDTIVRAVADVGARAVVTVGPSGDPSLLGDVPAGIHVERYIPQDQVLPHCAAVVSHAGSGTFLAAVGLGLPQVCVPMGADQYLNSAAAAQAGVAVVVGPDDRSFDRIRSALAQVLEDDSLRTNAEAVRADIDAMPGPSEVADILAARYRPLPR
jgi:UDP:flavonoid glycosyltransferase YjiC (YdhE family)